MLIWSVRSWIHGSARIVPGPKIDPASCPATSFSKKLQACKAAKLKLAVQCAHTLPCRSTPTIPPPAEALQFCAPQTQKFPSPCSTAAATLRSASAPTHGASVRSRNSQLPFQTKGKNGSPPQWPLVSTPGHVLASPSLRRPATTWVARHRTKFALGFQLRYLRTWDHRH
jgi:hypothetical protein